ncbi:hypothetical protein FQR65_LT17312 [Abscondita terminalis]|nr:hypothetical protein FQR65_LT17312 [Abscondita terminalis]
MNATTAHAMRSRPDQTNPSVARTYNRAQRRTVALNDNLPGLPATSRRPATLKDPAAIAARSNARLDARFNSCGANKREVDCALESFPEQPGADFMDIAQNDCQAHLSDERSEFLDSIAAADRMTGSFCIDTETITNAFQRYSQ